MKERVFQKCQGLFSGWAAMSIEDFEFDDPKGFSSFTMGVRSLKPELNLLPCFTGTLMVKRTPYWILRPTREVFLTLSQHEIAAHCHHYDETCRIEAFYQGRTLAMEDLWEPENLRQIADQLYRFHQLRPASLPR